MEGVTMLLVDLDRSAPFYRNVLSFAPVDTTTLSGLSVGHLIGVVGARIQRVTMRLGHETIHRMEFCTPQGRPIPLDSARPERLNFAGLCLNRTGVPSCAKSHNPTKRCTFNRSPFSPTHITWNL